MPASKTTALPPNIKDLTGEVFGYLTVVEYAGSCDGAVWRCRCVCGNTRQVRARILVSGRTKSCGCMRGSLISARVTKHGMRNTREYQIHHSMLKRCYCKSATSYKHYGAKGVTVCERWHKFENFLADMGRCPSDEHSIERRDPTGNYTPDNCAWIPMPQQAGNKRTTRWITFNGRTQSLAAWARECGIDVHTIRRRLKLGWDIADALSITPSASNRIGARSRP